MKITGAIFDVDGTLLDSLTMWKNIGANYLRSVGKNPKDDVAERITFMTLAQAADYFIDEYELEFTQKQICDSIDKMAEDFYYNDAQLKDGVEEFLAYLKDKGVRMSIATATDKYLVDNALKRIGVRDYFEDIFTCSQVGISKVDPKVYEVAHELIGTDKETTYIFEDMLFAIETAKKAGYNVVGIYDDFSKLDADKIEKTADKFIRSYSEMRGYFD